LETNGTGKLKVSKRIWKFTIELAQTWGGRVTGGIVIGIVGIWGLTGHPIATIVGWAIGIGAFIVAAFQVWNREVNANDQLRNDIEVEKRKQEMPVVNLWIDTGLNFGQDPWEFQLGNISETDAFNVKIEDILFPEGKATFATIPRISPNAQFPSAPELSIELENDELTSFQTLVDNQTEGFWEAATTSESREWPHPVVEIPITITYMDRSASKFIARYRILYDTAIERGRVNTYLIEMKPI
jgi:hypothetical protein